MLNKITKILWGLFLFTFPLSIRFIVYENASYRFGNFNPWVTGFLYLPEILLGIVFVLWMIQRFFNTKKDRMFHAGENLMHNAGENPHSRKWIIGLFSLFILNLSIITILKGDILLLAIFLLRIFEAGIVFLLIAGENPHSRILKKKTIITILIFGALFQIIWGYIQYQLNHSLGLGLIGEQIIGPDVLGVAKINLTEGIKQIRPYGSFLHPNILAAYLMSILFISLNYLKKQSLILWIPLLTIGIFLTHSRAAILATLAGFGLIILFKFIKEKEVTRWIGVGIITTVFIGSFWMLQNSHLINTKDNSWQERLNQNEISKEMIYKNPLGVGIKNFTLEMENYNQTKLKPWGFQPVHNTYLLILNETGIQGILIFFLLLITFTWKYWDSRYNIALLSLILIAPFDHFLWDSFAGIILIGIVLSFTSLSSSRRRGSTDAESIL